MLALNRVRPWFSIRLANPHPKPETILASVVCIVFLHKRIRWDAEWPWYDGYAPIRATPQNGGFMDLHDLDMVQIPCDTPDGLTHRVYLALFDDPALCPRDNALWEPPWESAAFEDQSCCQ